MKTRSADAEFFYFEAPSGEEPADRDGSGLVHWARLAILAASVLGTVIFLVLVCHRNGALEPDHHRFESHSVLRKHFFLDDLEGLLDGDIVRPWSRGYSNASSVWNKAAINNEPLAIVRASSTRDVEKTMEVMSRHPEIAMVVKSGGHSYGGFSSVDGGIVLSLKGLASLRVNAEGIATMGPAVSVQRILDEALVEGGWGGVVGDCSGVNEGGWVQGGGVGWLSRKHGLGVDNVLGFRAVLANGTSVEVSSASHPDLFFALRGGGGNNFAVVTEIKYQLYQYDDTQVFAKPMVPRQLYGSFMRRLGEMDVAGELPDEFCVTLEGSLEHPSGLKAFISWIAEDESGRLRGEEWLGHHLPLLLPGVDATVGRGSWAEETRGSDQFIGSLVSAHTAFLPPENNTAEVWEVLTETYAELSDNPFVIMELELWGGAIMRQPHDANAFAHRGSALFNLGWLLVVPVTTPNAEAIFQQQRARCNEVFSRILQYFSGIYLNYQNHDLSSEEYPGLYYGRHLERLQGIKRVYDPTNRFRYQQSIPI